tara:strand:+ start:26548 stop:27411 length:864 start_codon:yes stop_codon:yes gene_type:complete
MSDFAHPEVLVTTQWVDDHINDDGISVVEVNVDTELYDQGHITGAIGWSWKTQLADQVRRDILSKGDIEYLLSQSGINNESTIVLYGDSNNWFAAWAFWQLKVYGHDDVRLMDGGRKKWQAEGRQLTTELPLVSATEYHANDADPTLRAFLSEVQEQVDNSAVELVDVRSLAEFTGEILAPPGLPETCQRGGHIPGALNIPWGLTVTEDLGTFKSREELAELYSERGITGELPIITYCRIGERSSHSWFVLKYLLGYDNIKNYDGSWTEWGNLVGSSVELGEAGNLS